MACTAHRLIMAVKPGMRTPTVIEYAVQNQAHTFVSGILPQAQQRLVTTKLFVDVAIILRIVFMYAWGFKYRVQVQSRHAEFFQIRQFFADTVEIAAIKR